MSDQNIFNLIKIKKIEIDKKSKSLLVYVDSLEHLNSSTLEYFENYCKGEIEGINQIEVIFVSTQNFTLDEIIQKYKWYLIYKASRKCNGLKHTIMNSRIEQNDNKILIFVPNGIKDILIERKVDKYISTILQNEFDLRCMVEIQTEDVAIELDKDLDNINYEFDIFEPTDEIKEEIKDKKADLDENENNSIIIGKQITMESVKINMLKVGQKSAIEGEIINIEQKEGKNNFIIYKFNLTDWTSSIYIKIITKKDVDKLKDLKVGQYIKVFGTVDYDEYEKVIVIMAKDINVLEKPERIDTANEKRVELHIHTKMSAMDATSSAEDIINIAAKWGHKAIAITDHGVVQAYPEAMTASKKHNIKVIYGIEAYLVDDGVPIVYHPKEMQDFESSFVVFDIETTGFDPTRDKIIEIGAVKIKKGEIVDKFSTFVNPKTNIPARITKLTKIEQWMVEDAPTIDEVFDDFIDFCSDSILVAHNAQFDVGFIKNIFYQRNQEFTFTYIDTLELSRRLLNLTSHKLNKVAEHLNIELVSHHRAVDDAMATARIFLEFVDRLKSKGVKELKELNDIEKSNKDISKQNSYHATILVKNQKGLYNLYKLVSFSHLEYFYKRPRIPKSLLTQYKDGLIIGTACEAGELYRAIIENKEENEIERIAKYYDYFEIMPVENNSFLVRNGVVKDFDQLREINKRIYELGKKLNKLVVATSDAHYIERHERIFRQIIKHSQGYTDVDDDPHLYFRTTNEMLEEFSYLGEEASYEVVVKNTNIIADMIELVKPIPDETFPPQIEGAEQKIMEMTMNKAYEIYGNPLPEIVKNRLDKELNSIIKNGFSVMYLIAQKLVSKSLEDGYLVGSRGSVGSSLVATMCGITEVNPLPPHYYCPDCKISEFIVDGSIGSGYDLPDKECPKCSKSYKKDGQDIPFETFLGFDGDKEPDIDLNFSGEYQPVAHKYTEELFGEGHVFRAGTISTVAEKTAMGFVLKYAEEKSKSLHPAEIYRLSKGCTGVKRTTGQHPGGLMIVPKNKEIFEFTPIQHPADDNGVGVITTHFDYHSISGRLLKLDILGHDDPTVLKMLQDLTGLNPKTIPLDDKETMSIFTSTKALGITPEDIDCEVGTFGIPEFGTRFVRQMLIDTKPTTFSELIRISGLSHGTDVWLNNAQDLVRAGIATLKEVISTRDDIMLYLIYKGLSPKDSFKIMEQVRKGKGLKPEDEELMRKCNVPEWYIESCKKINYMFPKAHAAAYVMMAFRIAYFKVYYKEAFYATYFTVRADDFDYTTIMKGREFIREKIRDLENRFNNLSQKEKNLLPILEIANEMMARGLKFYPVDLDESDAVKFIIKNDGLLCPFNALPNVGVNAAKSIYEARKEGEFLSVEEFLRRTKVNKQVFEVLKQYKILKNIPETSQLSFI